MSVRRSSTQRSLSLTVSGVYYLIAAGLVLASAIYTQANLLFWSFGLLVGGLAASAATSWLMLRGVRVERILPEHGVAGEALVVRYDLRNDARWTPAFALLVVETWGPGWRGYKKQGPTSGPDPTLRSRPTGWVLHVGPGQRVGAEAPCWPTRRGELRFERTVLSTSFPFGLIRRSLSVAAPGRVLVYPRLHRMNRQVLARVSDAAAGGRDQHDRGGHEEFFGLREYRPGDSVRRIDWKRSARTGELIAREHTRPRPPRVMMALDLRPTPEAIAPDEAAMALRVERAVSLAASVVCDAHRRGYHLGLSILGVAAPGAKVFAMHHSPPHRARLLEALSTLDTRSLTDRSEALMVRPTVVVTLRPGQTTASAPGLTVLSAQSMELYVTSVGGQTLDLLAAGTEEPSRRELLRGAGR